MPLPTPAPVAATTPSPVAAKTPSPTSATPSGFIVYGALDSNDCPTPYERITNEKSCMAAAADMRRIYKSSGATAVYPPGCYSLDTDVYLNTATAGSKYPTAKLLCRGARLSLATVVEK